MMEEMYATSKFLKSQGITDPEIGLVLGTGLGDLATKIEVDKKIDYEDIPNFPLSTVESHAGKLIYGKIGGKQVLAMQGRFHYYEGYTMQQITFPIRVMALLGIKVLLLSNACGALNLDYEKGDLMIIDDHLNMLSDNPLIGKNIKDFGPRFPDMSRPYDPEIIEKMEKIALQEGLKVQKGVYMAVAGPNLETRAEYRAFRIMGADVVGMSTIPEVLVARHMGIPCGAVSVITDIGDPDNLPEVDIDEIIAIAGKAEKKLTQLFVGLINELDL